MKKYIIPTLAAFILLATGSAFAQTTLDTAEHEVTVTIPEVAILRFTNGNANAAVTSGLDLEFDFSSVFDVTDPDAFVVADLVGDHGVSNSPGWSDLKVFVNRSSTWSVTMELQNESLADASWDWSNIAVTPTGTGALANAFTLADSGIVTASSARGWNSLGFGPGDFLLTLDGSEIAGVYSATVVYTLTAP